MKNWTLTFFHLQVVCFFLFADFVADDREPAAFGLDHALADYAVAGVARRAQRAERLVRRGRVVDGDGCGVVGHFAVVCGIFLKVFFEKKLSGHIT